jgi:Mrp family chromosome partitioning ATPase/capsular polysaccharide biosynthesis protein
MTDPSGPSTGPAYATLQDYLRLLRRQRWLILAVTLIFAATAYAISSRQQPTYTAQATLAFRDIAQDQTLLGNAGVPELSPGERAAANAEVITRPEVAAAVKRRLHTDIPASALAGAISTRVDTLSNLVLMQASWGSPELAARLANAFGREAVRVSIRDQRRVIQRAIDVLRERLRQQPDPAADEVIPRELIQLEAIQSITRPAKVVRRAAIPGAPSSPDIVRNAILGGIVGLAIGLLLAFARDSLDRRLRGPRDVHEELELPVLGRVADDVLGRPLSSPNGKAPFSAEDFESFRVLRTNLEFLRSGERMNTVLVTCGLPEEGKSTTAAALAATAALAGRRTLLLECDLRRPSLSPRLGLREQPGLQQYLEGTAASHEVLQTVAVPAPIGPNGNGSVQAAHAGARLVCIAAGGPTPGAAELLGSSRFQELLANVGEAYDLVVIDSSPMLSVVDPLQMLPHVDGVLLCVRLSRTTRDQARATPAALARLPERPTGIVITGIGKGDAEQYGYYGYGYEA